MFRFNRTATLLIALASFVCVQSAAANPSVEDLFEKAVEAAGGRDAINNIQTLRTVMSASMAGQDTIMESLWSRAGGRMSKMTSRPAAQQTEGESSMAMPVMEIIMVTDGEIAWIKGPMGYMLLTEDQKQALHEQATLFIHILDPQEQMMQDIASIENMGKEVFEGKECWRLHYIENDGTEGDVYFDAATGLPLGFENQMTNKGKARQTRGVLSDWREHEGVMFYHKMTISSPDMVGGDVTMNVDVVEVNTLDESVFAAPPEVLALAEAQAAAGHAGDEIKLEDLTAEQQQTANSMLQGLKQMGNVAMMQQMVQRLEPAMGMMPADQQLPMKYVVQELKKEIARLGG